MTDTLPRKDGAIDLSPENFVNAFGSDNEIAQLQNDGSEFVRAWELVDLLKAVYNAAIDDAAKVVGEFDVTDCTPHDVTCDLSKEIKELKQ